MWINFVLLFSFFWILDVSVGDIGFSKYCDSCVSFLVVDFFDGISNVLFFGDFLVVLFCLFVVYGVGSVGILVIKVNLNIMSYCMGNIVEGKIIC